MFDYLGDFGEPATPAFLSSSREYTMLFLLPVLHILDMNERHSLLQLKNVPVSPDQSHSRIQSQTCQSQVSKILVPRSVFCPC